MSFTNDDWFVIKDVTSFVDSTRKLVFNSYGDNKENNDPLIELSLDEQKELDSLLSYEESYTIIKSIAKIQTNKKTKEKRFIINDSKFEQMIMALGDRMTSNILNGLVNKGIVEAAYDEDKDDFVFWIKDEKNNQKP